MANYIVALSSSYSVTAVVLEAGDITRRLTTYVPVITGTTTMPATITRSVISSLTFNAGGLSLTMPKPDFGDTDTLKVTVQSVQLSSGLIVINQQTDTSVRSKSFTFTGICEEKKKEYLTFIYTTVGQEVQLVDFEGTTSNILITSFDSEITETVVGYDITLEYEVI